MVVEANRTRYNSAFESGRAEERRAAQRELLEVHEFPCRRFETLVSRTQISSGVCLSEVLPSTDCVRIEAPQTPILSACRRLTWRKEDDFEFLSRMAR